jgi:hypothetical protein
MEPPQIHRCPLRDLEQAPMSTASTLVVPPARREPLSEARLAEFGLVPDDIIVVPDKD